MYAVFAQRKITVTSRLNTKQNEELQYDDQEFSLTSKEQSLQMQLSSLRQSAANAMGDMYKRLSEIDTTTDAGQSQREQIQAEIKTAEQRNQAAEEAINMQTYSIAQRESVVEQSKERVETAITKFEKELENIEKAESSGIDRANPKYQGLG